MQQQKAIVHTTFGYYICNNINICSMYVTLDKRSKFILSSVEWRTRYRAELLSNHGTIIENTVLVPFHTIIAIEYLD